MSGGLEPTEEYDGTITVRTFDDDGNRGEIDCPSYEVAIDVVKQEVRTATVVEIVDSDGVVVFDSVEMNIEEWAVEWKNAKRRLSIDAESRECPYDNVACFAEDLCVECQIDEVQSNNP